MAEKLEIKRRTSPTPEEPRAATSAQGRAGAPDSRARLISAAARLFQEKGYAATGLSDILTVAGAPKGSLYHHFPGGKAELAAAAMRGAGGLLRETLRARRETADDAAGAIEAFASDLAGWLEGSGFTRGCPLATVALEQTPSEGDLACAIAGAFSRTVEALAQMITDDGAPPDRARRLAGLTLAALEGAMILARIQQSGAPVREAGAEMARLVRAERCA
ncbi:TetR/AcrR family transcriptional regulator [Maricaulaceae bacterium MS644]